MSDAGLGLVLTGMAFGALAASPVAGRAVGRVGSRPVAIGAAVAVAASLWTVGAAPHPVALFLALAAIGAADAAMDIAMNANGAAYQRLAGRSLMHRLHGAWSLGALAAAGVAALLAAHHVSLTWHLLGVGVVVIAAALTSRSRMVADDHIPRHEVLAARAGAAPGPAGRRPARRPGRRDRRRRRHRGWAVRLVGAAARTPRRRPGAAALGFAAFAAGMLAGRLIGDRLTDRHGGAAVLRGGMVLVAVGLLAGALLDHPLVFGAGLVVAGVGAAGLFPLAFSAAATTPGVAAGAAAATVSLAARLGFMVEPVIMGTLAQLVGLRWAFVAVAALAVAVALAAPRGLDRPVRVVAGEEGTVADLRTG